MSKTMKKSIALMLVILQLIVLLPVTALNTRAADPETPAAETSAPVPTLNPVIEGSARFGSFNYSGDADNNRDGIDYVTTYYYSDDYFSKCCKPERDRQVHAVVGSGEPVPRDALQGLHRVRVQHARGSAARRLDDQVQERRGVPDDLRLW